MKYAIISIIEMLYITGLFVAYLYKPRLIEWEDKQADRCRRAARRALRRSKRVRDWAMAETLPEPVDVDRYRPGMNRRKRGRR